MIHMMNFEKKFGDYVIIKMIEKIGSFDGL